MNNFISPKVKKEEGITLVLALLLTGTVTVAALIIASLLVRELRLTDNIRKSLIAYYGAESGLESALYDYKTQNKLGDTHGDVAGISTWDINFGLGTQALNVSLPWETTKEIPLYDPDYQSFNVESINFCWSNCAGGLGQSGPAPAAIEWTILTLRQDAQGTWLEPGPRGAKIDRGIIDCAGKNEVPLDLSGAIPDWDAGDRHLLRFKHIDKYPPFGVEPGTIPFTITMAGESGPVAFNQETAFKVTGTITGPADVSRALDVAITPNSPAYNVFDYVIFSDTFVGKD